MSLLFNWFYVFVIWYMWKEQEPVSSGNISVHSSLDQGLAVVTYHFLGKQLRLNVDQTSPWVVQQRDRTGKI